MKYFAYGSNMDPVQMRERAPGARALGAALASGWRLTFTRDSPGWGGGVAHIEADPNDEVWGVLWEATESDMADLDDYEGISIGAYLRGRISVIHEGQTVDAVAYFAVPRGHKPPSRRYVNALVRGAQSHGLPEPYVERLRALTPGGTAPPSR